MSNRQQSAPLSESAQVGNLLPGTFQKHYQAIASLTREHKEMGMALARLKKAAKSDGVDNDSMKMMTGLAKLDPDEAIGRLRRMYQYASWVGLAIGTQAEMFSGGKFVAPSAAETEQQGEWTASELGHMAGKAGKLRVDDNPYDAGSANHAKWDEGYLDGQKQLAVALGKNAKVADARRARGKPTGPPTKPRGRSRNGDASSMF